MRSICRKYNHPAPLALAISSALALCSAQAAVITVDTNADPGSSGACSLRSAIETVNTQTSVDDCTDPDDGNLDIINFDASVTGSIELTEGMLTISESVVISGPGAGVLSIDAGGDSRVLRTTDGTIEISGLTITGGGSTSYGSGIYVAGTSQVTLSECVISGNHTDGYGGGIVHYSPSLTIDNCTISGNTSGRYGGGVAVYMGNTRIEGSTTITNNSATYMGGGLWVNGIYFQEGDTLSSEGDDSGRLRGAGGSTGMQAILHVEDSTVTGNQAYMGGGIGAGRIYSTEPLSQGLIFSDRTSDSGLLGLDMPSQANLVIVNSDISGNNAGYGGGIGATGYYVEDGGLADRGIIASYGRYNLIEIYDQTVINDNDAYYSGGGMFQKYTDSLIYNSDIIGNFAFYGGAGIFNLGNDMDSGGIYAQSERGLFGGQFRYLGMDHSTVVDNQLLDPTDRGVGSLLGAGILNARGETVVNGSEISDNLGADFGGGMATLDGAGLVFASLVSGNEGGGLLKSSGGLKGSIFSRIEGNFDAGGMICDGSGLCMTKYTSITNNQGDVVGGVANNMGLSDGGTLSLPESGSELHGGGAQGELYLVNSTVSGNEGGDVGGLAGSYIGLYHTTVAMNQQVSTVQAADGDRGIPPVGGAFLDSDLSLIDHSIIAGNSLEDDSPSDLLVTGIDPILMNYSLVQEDQDLTYSGSGNIFDQDPLLGPLDFNGSEFSMTHALLEGSPALDAGDPVLDTNLDYDQRGPGFPRVFNDVIDIGAFEFIIDEIFADRFEPTP